MCYNHPYTKRQNGVIGPTGRKGRQTTRFCALHMAINDWFISREIRGCKRWDRLLQTRQIRTEISGNEMTSVVVFPYDNISCWCCTTFVIRNVILYTEDSLRIIWCFGNTSLAAAYLPASMIVVLRLICCPMWTSFSLCTCVAYVPVWPVFWKIQYVACTVAGTFSVRQSCWLGVSSTGACCICYSNAFYVDSLLDCHNQCSCRWCDSVSGMFLNSVCFRSIPCGGLRISWRFLGVYFW